MTTSVPTACAVLPVKTLAKQILIRTPRESAKSEIQMRSVPLRTCYEACMSLTGPRESVLDYAACCSPTLQRTQGLHRNLR